MATIAANDTESLALGMLLNHIAHVPVLDPGLDTLLYGLFQTLPRVVDQLLGLFTDIANEEGFIQVAMEITVIDSHCRSLVG